MSDFQAPSPRFQGVTAVFFDLDDTLCGYWDASKAGLRQAFEEHFPKDRPAEEMMRHWATAFREFAPTLKQTGWYEGYLKQGEPTRTEQMRRTLLRSGDMDEALAGRLSEAYLSYRDANLKLFPDAKLILDRLRNAGVPLGLITNGPADVQRQEIATLGIGDYFGDRVFIEGELGFGKPIQKVFEQAAASVQRSPEEIVMVGNSYQHDIKAAIAAGWKTVWVRRPSDVPPSADRDRAGAPEERPESDPEPTLVINHLSELLGELI